MLPIPTYQETHSWHCWIDFSGHDIAAEFHDVALFDSDTRRVVRITLPNPHGFDFPEDDPDCMWPLKKAADALEEHLANVPPETVGIEVDEAERLLAFGTSPDKDSTRQTEYPRIEQFQLPAAIAAKTVLRSELVEIRRFVTGVDLVSNHPPSPSLSRRKKDPNRYVFKYCTSSFVSGWAEIQMLSRLPPHPHLVLLDRLVLDEITKSQVVGFTMRYVPSEPLDKSRLLFKLKWLKQLIQTVDDLNLKYGIVHQDIADRNLLVDPDTDSILLFDFNFATRLGVTKPRGLSSEGRWPGRDNVKGVLVFLYEYITRDPALSRYMLHMFYEKDYLDPAKWIKHPDVRLDSPVADFYLELMAWVRRRRAGTQLMHYTEAPEHLDWPDVLELTKGQQMQYTLAERISDGTPFLNWKRPSKSRLDPKRQLLATGRYADEEAAAQAEAARAAEAAVGRTIRPVGIRVVEDWECAPIIEPIVHAGPKRRYAEGAKWLRQDGPRRGRPPPRTAPPAEATGDELRCRQTRC